MSDQSSAEAATTLPRQPIVIGHRGACGYLPEHTLASYELAIALGADFIEPDLVSTGDGVLIARHENEIGGVSDVAQRFPERKTRKIIDGHDVEGWFTEDFTLAEIKTLRARERLDFRDQSSNGLHAIPTFQEIIHLAKRKSVEKGRVIGVYPETKHPSYFRSIGLGLEEPLVALLTASGWDAAHSPVFIQSFEYGNLQALSTMIDVPLIFLLDEPQMQPYDFTTAKDPRTYGDLTAPHELRRLAAFASGIGPWKRLIVGEHADQTLKAPGSLVTNAHAVGLLVHPFTFRNEARFLAPAYRGDPVAEYLQFYALGVDGLFSDFPDVAVKARESFLSGI